MIPKGLLLKLYDGAYMSRWNDQIRVVDFFELDKQAHKMMIAYVLGKIEEKNKNPEFSWQKIIEAGIFEFLQRIVLTDLKPELFHRLKKNRDKYLRLNNWVYEKIQPLLMPVNSGLCSRFKAYLTDENRDINRRIISAAHFYSTKWEYDIISNFVPSPCAYMFGEITKDLARKQEAYHNLQCMQDLLFSQRLKYFLNLCGLLRFQIRWSHIHRVPETSVLGHLLVVAMITYFSTLEFTTDKERIYNNYFTALFHDLPEVLTRDVINPVKRSVQGIDDLIHEYERDEMEKRIYSLLPDDWHSDIRLFTENEFGDIEKGDKIIRDGQLIKGVDELSAFLEVWLALNNGIRSPDLLEASKTLRNKYKDITICGIDFSQIYDKFTTEV